MFRFVWLTKCVVKQFDAKRFQPNYMHICIIICIYASSYFFTLFVFKHRGLLLKIVSFSDRKITSSVSDLSILRVLIP